MRCKEIQSWTFSELVGAYLDLAITYLLLCASALAFLASKFLDLFGLCLPCPCNGLFSDPIRNKCWQRVLVECPSKNVSSVQFSILSRLPFDSIWDQNSDSESFVSAINQSSESEAVGLDGEASCNSSLETKSEIGVGSGVIDGRNVEGLKFDVKGKRVWSQEARYFRRHRKGVFGIERLYSASSYDRLQADGSALHHSPASVTKIVNKSNEDAGESSLDIGFSGSEPFDENELKKEDELSDRDLKYNVQGEFCFAGDEKNAIMVLEHALEQEHAARTALYLELEKERSAATSAADEAMAMILRLQEEKALIEMESRQYQRMIDEKAAYDFEEMSILKEILVRREREIHFLEKEVEAYRKMIFQDEQLDYGIQDNEIMDRGSAGQGSSYLHGSIYLNKRAENMTEFLDSGIRSTESQSCTITLGKELPIPELKEVEFSERGSISRHTSIDNIHNHLPRCNVGIEEEFDEKGLESLDKSIDQVKEVRRLEPFSELDLSTGGYGVQESGTANILDNDIATSTEWLLKTIGTYDQTKTILPYSCDDSEKHEKNSRDVVFDKSPCVHDVHVIDEKIHASSREEGDDGSEKQSINVAALEIPRTCNSPKISMPGTKKEISRSCSELDRDLPPISHPRSKSLLSDLRRNSMSVVDFERFKIDSEVGWLRERLRIVQKGREKLNFSSGHNREKVNTQLQLLDNITSQLREIRQLTEPGKVLRLTSLPSPTYKGTLMKRNWRSVSLGVHRSS